MTHPVVASSTTVWYLSPRDGHRHAGVPHDQRAARHRDVVPVEHPRVAAVRDRVRAPQRLIARGRVPRAARDDRDRRFVRAHRLERRGDPLRVALPADLVGPRHGRLRSRARAHDHQPAAPPHRIPDLARGPLVRVPVLAGRRGPRSRHRDRHQVGCRADHHGGVRGGRARRHGAAAGERSGRPSRDEAGRVRALGCGTGGARGVAGLGSVGLGVGTTGRHTGQRARRRLRHRWPRRPVPP